MRHNPMEMLSTVVNTLNENLSEYSPTTVILGTVASVLMLQKSIQLYQHWNPNEIKKNLIDKAVKVATHLPYIGPKVKAEIDKEVNGLLSEIQKGVNESRREFDIVASLPQAGLPEETIRERFSHLQKHYHDGRLSGAVYAQYDKELSELVQFVWEKTALTNPMHSEWPLINLMEAEVISMCQQLLHGDAGTTGIMTHGGSTSILEACKAYVLLSRENGITHPEIIVPDSVHVAFDKAAEILNVRLVKVPVDPETGAADIAAMEAAITRRTCMMVGSAPSFPLGIIDPIESLGEIAQKHGVPLHVDGCLGGFLTPFAADAGFEIPQCDFSVPGVTSIAIDTHKYGQTPKGTSVLLFSPKTAATPTHVHLDWVGGMYVTPGIDGSRSGADIAVAWAVLCYKGKDKYIDETKKILTLQRHLLTEISKIDGLIVPHNPLLSVIPIQTKESINALLVADQLKQAGWSVSILQTADQKPAGFHFCLTSVHAHQDNFAPSFLAALESATAYAKAHPTEKPKGTAKAYGKLEKGVPHCVQRRIGVGYVKAHNTLWSDPAKKPADQNAHHSQHLKMN